MKNPYEVIKTVLVTEKSSDLVETGKYTFRVPRQANKIEVRSAVEQVFNVSVTAVNTCNYQGKSKRTRGSSKMGRRPSWKKAVVTLKAGDEIELL